MRGKRDMYQVGQVFGLLTITKRWTEPKSGNRSKESLCECICSCGNKVITPTRYIANGHKKSCGCLQYKRNKDHHHWKGHGEIGAAWWTDLKNGCIRRNKVIPFDLTIEQIWELFLKQNRKCAISGIDIKFSERNRRYDVTDSTASLDRIDSTKGYTMDNIQWVHKTVNLIKWTLTQAEFINWCKIISTNQS